MEYLMALLVTVLGNLITYFVTKAVEERESPRKKHSPKHMREG